MAKKRETRDSQPGTEMTNWEEEMGKAAQEIAKTEQPSVNKIKFTSGVMSYMDVAMENNTLDCIIVAHCAEHVLYMERYQAGVVVPPDCFALGPSGEPMFPHANVPQPKNDNCTGCEMFKWGSDLQGGRGKACTERRRLAIIPAPQSLDDIKNSDLAVMSIPVTSVKQWANYVNKLSAASQRPPWGVLTRVSLVPDPKSQFKVKFGAQTPLDQEQLPLVHARIDVALNSLMIPYEMNPESTQEEEGKKKY